LNSLQLKPEDEKYTINLIAHHNTFSLDYCQTCLSPENKRDPRKDAKIIKQTEPKIALELLLHIIADEYGTPITQSLRDYLLTEVMAKYSLL